MRLPRPKPKFATERRAAAAAARIEVEELTEQPLISVVMPTFDPPLRYLRESIESVRRQSYPRWELCIADDGSTDPRIRRMIDRYVAADARVKASFSEHNRGISAASNRALALCDGELVAFLDHDDALASNALLRTAQAFAAEPIDAVYSDQDKIDGKGRRRDPFFKPDWSPVHMLGVMYVGHLLVLRRSLAEQAGGFDSAFDGIQDFELMLRVSERTDRVGHIPEILYHWRAIPGSIAAGEEEKSGIPKLQAKAVSAHLARRGAPAHAVPHPTIPHRARLVPDPDPDPPKVSVVIVAGERPEALGRCLERLFETTRHPNFEVIVVKTPGNGDAAGGGHPVQMVTDSGHVYRGARAANLGAREASGEYLVFLADTTEVRQADWMEQLVMYARLPNVGAVGPLLVYPDGKVCEAGLALGLEDPAVPVMRGRSADGDGYYGSLPCAREVSAISGECMLVPRAIFEQVGGFKEAYSTQFEALDLCQELRRRGLGVIYVPEPAMVSHQTSAAREASFDVLDRALFVDCWYEELARGDPYFNPNFSPDDANYTLEPTPSWVKRAALSGKAPR